MKTKWVWNLNINWNQSSEMENRKKLTDWKWYRRTWTIGWYYDRKFITFLINFSSENQLTVWGSKSRPFRFMKMISSRVKWGEIIAWCFRWTIEYIFCSLLKFMILVYQDTHEYTFMSNTLLDSVNTEMPFHSILNAAEENTCSRHVTINPLLLAQSALDLLHFTRHFQRN